MVHHLVRLTDTPQVHETARSAQHALITPTDAFYIRNHFQTPRINPAEWRLHVEGLAARTYTLADLRAMPSRLLPVTLECAGNSRAYFSRPTEGVKFTHGGVSHAEWRGVALREVLSDAGVPNGALEAYMKGADEGEHEGQHMAYERGLPIAKALHPDTLLAYEMNGQPLTAEHGAPVRAIVPGWYGMASVKWLTRIAFLDAPFRGFFQYARYQFERPNKGDYQEPVDLVRVKSIVLTPQPKDVTQAGPVTITGVAWAGEHALARVRVSVDDGETWREAEVPAGASKYSWVHWTFTCTLPPGSYTLLTQAIDTAGNAQALAEDWNYHGYANSMAQSIPMTVIL